MKGRALTPSEVRRVFEPFQEHPGGSMVRCYYCSDGGSTETTVLEDGEPVSRWVCSEHADHSSPKVRCYYCASEDAFETTVLKDGKPVCRWVCVEHAVDPPKRVGMMSTRLKRIVRSGSRANGSRLLRWR